MIYRGLGQQPNSYLYNQFINLVNQGYTKYRQMLAPPPPLNVQSLNIAIPADPPANDQNMAPINASWFEQNKLYVYGAAAILAAAFLLKRK